MPLQAFCCKLCFTPYKDEKAAASCEESHCPEEGVNLKSVRWTGRNPHSDRWIPDELVVEVPVQHPVVDDTEEIVYVRKREPQVNIF